MSERRTWRFRRDVPLSSAATLVLIQDLDGELVIRVMIRREFVTPKIRVSRDRLESLLVPHDHRIIEADVVIDLDGRTAAVSVAGQLSGWTDRRAVQAGIKELLREVDAAASNAA